MFIHHIDGRSLCTRDFKLDIIYVSGSSNMPNLKLDDENGKICLIKGGFLKSIWDVEVV